MKTSSLWFLTLSLMALVSVGQVSGSSGLVLLAILGIYVSFLTCPAPMLLPLALFWLPWASVIKTSPNDFSNLTIALLLGFGRVALSKGVFPVAPRLAIPGLVLGGWLFGVRFFLDKSPDFDLYATLAMFALFPIYVLTVKRSVRIHDLGVGLSLGIITSSLVIRWWGESTSLATYVVKSENLQGDIVRLSGFVGDPNFYATHALVAIAAVLVGWLRNESRSSLYSLLLLALVVYLGATSLSKTFVLALFAMAIFLCIFVPLRRGMKGVTAVAVVGVVALVALLETNVLQGIIQMYSFRFSLVTDLQTLTTSRSGIQEQYVDFLLQNPSNLFFGQGMTREYPFGLAAHNSYIQAVYLFGLLGVLILAWWTLRLFSGPRGPIGERIPLLIAVLFPWAGLDAIFFSDFFLFLGCLACATSAPISETRAAS